MQSCSVQVSAGALAELLTNTGSSDSGGGSRTSAVTTTAAVATDAPQSEAAAQSSSTPSTSAQAPLTVEDVREVSEAAKANVQVPASVVNLLVDLRTHMQEALEPPAYISDRRMVKAVELLQACSPPSFTFM